MTKTLINIKDELLEKAKRMTGLGRKVDIVNFALEKLLEQKEIEKIITQKGKVNWRGNLNKMRENRK